MEITARSVQGFFRCTFPEKQIVTIGNNKDHDVCLPEHGGLGTCDRGWYRYTRAERRIDPYLPKGNYLTEAFCHLLESNGVLFIRAWGLVYTWLRDEPLHGTKVLHPTEPLHINGVELAINWSPQEKTVEEAVQDPNLTIECLQWLSEAYPVLVAKNPIIPLFLLEDPRRFESFPEGLRRALLAH